MFTINVAYPNGYVYTYQVSDREAAKTRISRAFPRGGNATQVTVVAEDGQTATGYPKQDGGVTWEKPHVLMERQHLDPQKPDDTSWHEPEDHETAAVLF